MSKTFHDIKLGLDEDLEEKLAWLAPNYGSYHILKKSVDARRRHEPHLIYSVEVFDPGENPPKLEPLEKIKASGDRPVIVGAGPAGLFAALRFIERGVPCILLERGGDTKDRMKAIAQHWRYGNLDPENNVCFGEGGAGLFSDGKLITRIKSPHIPYVLEKLVEFGAPEEIKFLANPHVGSDKIRRVIPKIREYILKNGGEIRFNTKVEEILFEGTQTSGVKLASGEILNGPHVILATGHSAEDIFESLEKSEVTIEGKSFAVGLRIEHPQKLIDEIQYRQHAGHPKLGAANYRLNFHDKETDTGVYSFCMCPGGYVLSCGTSPNTVVSNGMSNYNRNSPYANAAIVVTVDHEKSFGPNKFGGLEFRRSLEQGGFDLVQKSGGTKELPGQRLTDFVDGKASVEIKSSCPSGVTPTRLDEFLPEQISRYLKMGIEKFQKSMNGFLSEEATLIGVETRTSCPVRITRDKDSLESVSHQGLYPTGEGAGYAGGITSAACDGIKVAEAIITKISTRV